MVIAGLTGCPMGLWFGKCGWCACWGWALCWTHAGTWAAWAQEAIAGWPGLVALAVSTAVLHPAVAIPARCSWDSDLTVWVTVELGQVVSSALLPAGASSLGQVTSSIRSTPLELPAPDSPRLPTLQEQTTLPKQAVRCQDGDGAQGC